MLEAAASYLFPRFFSLTWLRSPRMPPVRRLFGPGPWQVPSPIAANSRRKARRTIVPLLISAFFGGLLGAQILLHTPQATFLRLVPWLLLSATLLFVASHRYHVVDSREIQTERAARDLMNVGVAILQLVVGIYIGYFGAGSGIMILALLSVPGNHQHSCHEWIKDASRERRQCASRS